MANNYKLAYLVTHPIQYQVPLLRYISTNSNIDLTALFMSDFSIREHVDPGFNAKVKWDISLTEGYKHVFLPSIGPSTSISAYLPFSVDIAKQLKRGKFDALWVHGYYHPVHLRAIAVAKSLGIKVFTRCDAQIKSAVRRTSTRRVKEAALRYLFSVIDGFLAIGSMNHDYYTYYGVPDERIFTLPYAVDNDFFQSRVKEASLHRDSLRGELGLEANRPVILYASKFQSRKRVVNLIEAYSQLPRTDRFPYLLLVGDGEDRALAEQRIHELNLKDAKLLGFKNQTELPAYFDLCDVFVLASDHEPWGLIINEVMNAGRAVIVSDEVGAAPDLVRDGVNGYVIPVGDVAALTNRLADVLKTPNTIRSMGDESLKIINQWGFREDLIGLEEALGAVVGGTRQQ